MNKHSKLKELRQSRDISQIEMSLLLDMSLSNYCNYEARRYVKMPKDLKEKIDVFFKTNFEYEGRWY